MGPANPHVRTFPGDALPAGLGTPLGTTAARPPYRGCGCSSPGVTHLPSSSWRVWTRPQGTQDWKRNSRVLTERRVGRTSSLKATQSKLDSECRRRCYQGAALGCGGNVSPLRPSAECCREDCVSPSLRGVWCSFSCRLEFESIGKHPGGSFCFYPRGETIQNRCGHWHRADEFHGCSRTRSSRSVDQLGVADAVCQSLGTASGGPSAKLSLCFVCQQGGHACLSSGWVGVGSPLRLLGELTPAPDSAPQ